MRVLTAVGLVSSIDGGSGQVLSSAGRWTLCAFWCAMLTCFCFVAWLLLAQSSQRAQMDDNERVR